MRKCGECGSEEELLSLVYHPLLQYILKKSCYPPSPLLLLILYIYNLQYSSKQLLILIRWSSIFPTYTYLQHSFWTYPSLPLSSLCYLVNYDPPPKPHSLKSHLTTPCYLNRLPSSPPPSSICQQVTRCKDRVPCHIIQMSCSYSFQYSCLS